MSASKEELFERMPVTKAVFEIPFILIFSRMFGLYGLCFCVACAEFLMSVIALIVLKRLIKKL